MGSGYVSLAFLRADLVGRWRWLTESQLLDARFLPGIKSDERQWSIELNRKSRAFVPPDLGEKIEYAFGPSVLAIQEVIRMARFGYIEPPGRGVNPIAFDIAAHIARDDAHARVIANSVDLVRMGHGVEIQHALILDEPERRAHAAAVSAIALQVYIFLVGELREIVISHSDSPIASARRPCGECSLPI
jgi:hypothetical protein